MQGRLVPQPPAGREAAQQGEGLLREEVVHEAHREGAQEAAGQLLVELDQLVRVQLVEAQRAEALLLLVEEPAEAGHAPLQPQEQERRGGADPAGRVPGAGQPLPQPRRLHVGHGLWLQPERLLHAGSSRVAPGSCR